MNEINPNIIRENYDQGKNMRRSYIFSKAIIDTIKSNPEQQKITSDLMRRAIDTLMTRAERPRHKKKTKGSDTKDYEFLSEMDAYYIPDNFEQDLTDSDLLVILDCITPSDGGFEKLNYILDRAAEHTMRQMEQDATKHSDSYLNTNFGKWKKQKSSHWESDKEYKADTSRYGIGYFKRYFKQWADIKFSPKDQKCKVHFRLENTEDWISFARSLLSSQENSKNEFGITTPIDKSFSRTQKDGLFLKNIITSSDIEHNNLFTDRNQFLGQIITEIFYPLFHIDATNTEEFTKTLPNGEREFSIPFSFSPYKDRKPLKGKFVLCTKSRQSMVDKCRRDINYSASKNVQDIIRGSIIMDNHEDLIYMMHYFAKYYIADPETNFQQDKSIGCDPNNGILLGLKIKDKGILNTNIKSWKNHISGLPVGTPPEKGKLPNNDSERDWAASQFLKNASTTTSRKSSNAEMYIDTKYIIPIKIRGVNLPLELKFLVKSNEQQNNKGLQSHSVMRLKQTAKRESRDTKHVSASKINHEAGLLLNDKTLVRDIEGQIESTTDLGQQIPSVAEKLYKELTKNLVVMYQTPTKDGWKAREFCDPEIWENLQKEGYAPDLTILGDIIRDYQGKREREIELGYKQRLSNFIDFLETKKLNLSSSFKKYITDIIDSANQLLEDENLDFDQIKTIREKVCRFKPPKNNKGKANKEDLELIKFLKDKNNYF